METEAKVIPLCILLCAVLLILYVQPMLNPVQPAEANGSSAILLEKTIQPDSAMLQKAESVEKTWKYSLLLPQSYNASRKYPLIIRLHGAGGSATDYARMWQPEADKYGFIVACPQSNDSAWWTLTANYMIIAVVDDVKNNYNVSDVFLTGHSAGAKITYSTALWNPGVFKGVAPVSSSFGTFVPEKDDLENAKGQNFYILHGESDNVIPLVNAMNARNTLEAAGVNVTFRILPNHGHEYPTEENDNIAKWFLSLENSSS